MKYVLFILGQFFFFSGYSQDTTGIKTIGAGNFLYFLKSATIKIDGKDSILLPINTRILIENKKKSEIFPIHLNDTIDFGIEVTASIKRSRIFDKGINFLELLYYRTNQGKWKFLTLLGHTSFSFKGNENEYQKPTISTEFTDITIVLKNHSIDIELVSDNWYYKHKK